MSKTEISQAFMNKEVNQAVQVCGLKELKAQNECQLRYQSRHKIIKSPNGKEFSNGEELKRLKKQET